MAAAIKAGDDAIEILNVNPLFVAQLGPGIGMQYDVSADGKRFVFIDVVAEGNVPITLVTNWTAELEK